MKIFLLSLLLAAATLGNSGCAFMSDEDRDFYGKGWVKPGELDTAMPHHAITDAARHQPEVAPAKTSPSANADATQWLVPEQAPQ